MIWKKPVDLYVLFIGEKVVSVYEITTSEVTLRLSLNRLEDKAQLQDFLHGKRCRILIDNSALQFSSTSLPKMAPWDRYLHLKHKRGLLGESVQLKDIRVHHQVVMQSYAKASKWLEGWLADLKEIESISFFPLEIQDYGQKTFWMFLGILEEGFLRQIIYDSRQILSARLTQIPPGFNPFELQDFVEKDIRQALIYLKKSGMDLPSPLQGFSQLPFDLNGIHSKPFLFEDFLKAWSQRKPHLNFRKPHFRFLTYFQSIKYILVAAFIFVISYDLYDIYQMKGALKDLEVQKHQLVRIYEKLENEINGFDVPQIRKTLEKLQDLQQKTHPPTAYLSQIVPILNSHSGIQILDFYWENNHKDKSVRLILHVKAHTDALFQNFHAALVRQFHQDNVVIQKAPFSDRFLSGAIHEDENPQEENEETGVIEVKWA